MTMDYLDKETFRKLLLALRSQLRGDVNLLLDTALDVAINDPLPKPDDACRRCSATWRTSVAGSVRDFIERLIDRKEALLYHVENALERLDDGSYGICQSCDSHIAEEWLLTVPYTALCASCQSQQAAA
jgi:RNA polymerase-binding transcription factor DksA